MFQSLPALPQGIGKMDEARYKSYEGLGQTSMMAQHHPDVSNKPVFKDMLMLSQRLDSNLRNKLNSQKSQGQVKIM